MHIASVALPAGGASLLQRANGDAAGTMTKHVWGGEAQGVGPMSARDQHGKATTGVHSTGQTHHLRRAHSTQWRCIECP